MTSLPAVRQVDEGSVVVIYDRPGELAALLAAGRRAMEHDGRSVSGGLRRLTALLLACSGPVSDLNTPVVSSAALREVLSGSPSSLSVAEAAVRLSVGEHQVRKLRRAGKLRPAGRGRVLSVDVARRVGCES